MSDPKPSLDLASTTTIVIASMIGVGVYTTSGFTLSALQNPMLVVIAWAVGGVIAICGAIGYSRLASQFHESGGEYLFLSKTVHPSAGIMAGWVSMLAGFTGAIAAAALGIEEYTGPLIESVVNTSWIPKHSIAISCVAIAGVLHCIKVNLAARVQDAIVFVKLLMLIGFIGFAILSFNAWFNDGVKIAEAGEPAAFNLISFATQLVWISFSYAGFNAAIYIAGEVVDAKRNVPRAMILGTFLVTILYVMLNTIFVYSTAPDVITSGDNITKIASVAAQSLGGASMKVFVSLVIIVSLFTSVSALVMTGPRVYAKMADDGVLPSWFSFRKTTPAAAIIFQCIAAILVITVSSLAELLGYLGLTLSLCSALTVASIYFIRESLDNSRQTSIISKLPGLASIFYVVATLILAILYVVGEVADQGKPYSAICSGITLSLGWIWFAVLKYREKRINH